MSAWVLVPCPRHRLDELRTLLADLEHDPAAVVVVTTTPDPILDGDVDGIADHLALCDKPGMWFSAWVNTGLDVAYSHGASEVLVVGSDARGTPASVRKLAGVLNYRRLVMVGPDWHNQCAGRPWVTYGGDDERTLWNRVPGACFMLAAQHRLRMCEDFRWWYSDDALEMEARAIGRVGLVAGTGLTHTTDHPLDETQKRHAEQDRAKFVERYGVEPW